MSELTDILPPPAVLEQRQLVLPDGTLVTATVDTHLEVTFESTKSPNQVHPAAPDGFAGAVLTLLGSGTQVWARWEVGGFHLDVRRLFHGDETWRPAAGRGDVLVVPVLGGAR